MCGSRQSCCRSFVSASAESWDSCASRCCSDARILGDGIDKAYYVGQVGDLDGDGFDDLAIGAPIANVREGATGSLYLFLGGTGP